MSERWSIERVELRRIAMPLVAPFRTSFGSQTERDILLVRVDLLGGDGSETEGWGECVALSEPSWRGVPLLNSIMPASAPGPA